MTTIRRLALLSAAMALACGLAAAATAQQAADMTFFVTSVGSGKGADLGGLAGADAHCQQLAEAAGAGGKPGMTGTLTLRYRRGTPLGDLRVEGWIDRVDGIKTFAKAHIIGPDGVTVEAEGVMILPRWAREAMANQTETPTYFE